MARISASYDVLFALTAAVSRGVSEYAIRSADGEIALVARISTASADDRGWYCIGNVPVDIDWPRRTVSSSVGRTVLSDVELRLMDASLRSNGGVVRHAKLAGQITVRRPGSAYRPNTLAVRICGLRKRLALVGARKALVAVRGVGYRLVQGAS